MEPLNTDHSGIDLPSAPEAESALLACIIEDPRRFAPKAWESNISSEFFHNQANAALFGMLMDRIRKQSPVDPSSIKEDIRKAKLPNLKLSTLAKILNAEISLEGWDGYLDAIRDTHTRRIIIEAGKQAHDKDGRSALDALRIATEQAQAAISGVSALKQARPAVEAFLQEFKERYENGAKPGLQTGIEQLDNHTGGMRKGELWVIGAKTSGGKSILMMQIASAAIEAGKRVAIFTLELQTDEVVGRLISCLGRIPISMIMNPKTLSDHYLGRVKSQAMKLKDTGFMVCDSADLSIDAISGHCIRIKESEGLDLVVIDYIQLVSSPRIKGQNREQEVATISKACKQLAKRLKCPVLTATQLNEQNQARESRAIENDSDNLLMIEHGKDGTCGIHVWKCRNGKRGVIYPAEMDGLHQKFKVSDARD